jgi:NTE family protein
MGDYRVGLVHEPRVRLCDAVAASSAFPPILSPIAYTQAQLTPNNPLVATGAPATAARSVMNSRLRIDPALEGSKCGQVNIGAADCG